MKLVLSLCTLVHLPVFYSQNNRKFYLVHAWLQQQSLFCHSTDALVLSVSYLHLYKLLLNCPLCVDCIISSIMLRLDLAAFKQLTLPKLEMLATLTATRLSSFITDAPTYLVLQQHSYLSLNVFLYPKTQ